MKVKHRAISKVVGPLVFIEGVKGIKYGEMVEVEVKEGARRIGQVIEVKKDIAIAQVLGGTSGISKESTISKTGHSLEMPLSKEMLGRVFDGLGNPLDGGREIRSEKKMDINGSPMNPVSRAKPEDFIETGISCIDTMLSIVRGQKIPIFSGSGLPHNKIAAQIVRQAKIAEKEKFVVIFAAIGITSSEAEFFINDFQRADILDHTIVFMSLADEPSITRLATPRFALTAAEYFAYELKNHVLVVLNDMRNYCEALREVSLARGEIPGRRAYPGYMYTDLATLFERSGKLKGEDCSITQIPVLTMPADDITHPIPDLTGYITEGQVVLSRDLSIKGVYPPIEVIPSLSRLMNSGIGKGRTREDHAEISNRLYTAYAEGMSSRDLAVVMGEGSLTERERKFLKFADVFEKNFLNQGPYERRSIEESLDLALETLSILGD